VIADNQIRRRARNGFGNEAEQIVRGLARLRSGTHDGAIVFAQDLELRADIIGMAHGRHDPERRAAERGTQLNHQFLEGVFLGAVGSALVAVETRGMPGRMRLYADILRLPRTVRPPHKLARVSTDRRA
jgi:hypothetical protein